MAISKVILNGVTQMDVTQDTVEANKLLYDYTATKNDGTKVTGSITSKSSSDLTASGATVTAPAGYYASSASKSVASGSVTAPSTISGSSASISTGVVGANGLTLTKTVSVTPNVTTAGYISSGTAGNSSVSLAANVPIRGNISLTELTGTITAPAGYYPNDASRTVTSGTAGTPTATKGTVANHSVAVTPSVTNTTGYITGDTKTGTAVTVSASELVSGNLDITENGEDIDVTNYATVSVDVAGSGPSGQPGTWYQDEDGYIVISDYPVEGVEEKLINFYDYDGTRIYSYTSAEWANVTTLPDNPTHRGLTAQGWNWTKNQIDAQLSAAPGGVVNVGQIYITSSGATEIDINLDDPEYLHPYLFIQAKGEVSVDWGDGTTADTISGGTSLTDKRQGHLYSTTGKYTVSITVPNGSEARFNVGSYVESPIFTAYAGNDATPSNRNFLYTSAITAIRIGNNFSIGTKAFYKCISLEYITIPLSATVVTTSTDMFNYCMSLKYITFPSSVSDIITGSYFLQYCESLKIAALPYGITEIGAFGYSGNLTSITIPYSVTTIDASAFQYCLKLRSVALPYGLTTISQLAFSQCQWITKITIPSTVTSIGNSVFSYVTSLKEVHLLPTTPPTLGTGVFYTTNNCIANFYVPYSSDHSILTAYQTATNWSTYASYMQEEPQ